MAKYVLRQTNQFQGRWTTTLRLYCTELNEGFGHDSIRCCQRGMACPWFHLHAAGGVIKPRGAVGSSEITKMDTLGIEPRASRMLSGCDTTTPCARMHRPRTCPTISDHVLCRCSKHTLTNNAQPFHLDHVVHGLLEFVRFAVPVDRAPSCAAVALPGRCSGGNALSTNIPSGLAHVSHSSVGSAWAWSKVDDGTCDFLGVELAAIHGWPCEAWPAELSR